MINNKFNFYKVYLNDLNKLRSSQFKKVINALSDYAETGKLPLKLKAKSMMVFSKIIVVIDTEKKIDIELQKKRDAGRKGGKHRWDEKNRHKESINKHKDSTK